MRHYPAVVVGSGPGGSSCAKALADAGVPCLVVEKRSLPRHKTCSGIVYGQCQELLEKYFGQLPPADVRCSPEFVHADNVVEYLPDGTTAPYVWELPKDGHAFSRRWINIWRDRFDHWLLGESKAEVMEKTRFVGFETLPDGKVKVCLKTGGRNEELTCDYLVSAEGSISQVRNALDREAVESAPSALISYAYYEYSDTGTLHDDTWHVWLWPEHGDIISCVHHKDDLLALTVGGMKGVNLLEFEERFTAHLVDVYGVKIGARRFATGCMYHLAPPFLGKGRVLLCGDAAGLVYLNGEGMSSAIDSGYRAGQTISKALGNGGGDCAQAYAANCDDVLRHMDYCMKNMRFVVPR